MQALQSGPTPVRSPLLPRSRDAELFEPPPVVVPAPGAPRPQSFPLALAGAGRWGLGFRVSSRVSIRLLHTHTQSSVVAGGGAIEMEISRHLRDYSKTIDHKVQAVVRYVCN